MIHRDRHCFPSPHLQSIIHPYSHPLQSTMPIQRDDQYFRTVTSLLRFLRVPDYAHCALTVLAGSRNNFKRMPAASFLLAHGTEEVACIPRHLVEKITLFCMPNRRVKRKEHSRSDLLVAKNPVPDETPAASGCSVHLEGEAAIHSIAPQSIWLRNGEKYFAIF